ncbi:MAG: ABC transporter substrate-binding protein, partial [Chloroflexi bacterium]
RSKDEERSWTEERDPLRTFAATLLASGGADSTVFDRIEEELRTEIQEGVSFALEAPYPEPDEVTTDVYA